MIPFNFEYFRPNTVKEAIELFHKLKKLGKKPIYYGGGSEFISMARMNNVYTEAVIDIKGIQECNEYKIENDKLIIGAGVTLTKVAVEDLFPLLSMAVKRIADHTMQGKITIGGNICGTIVYREAVLPLLVSNSEVVIANKDGERIELLMDIFKERLQLETGEMLVKIIVPKKFLNFPHAHVKRTKNEVIDYPLVSMVALKHNGKINIAFSGLGDYPFRSIKLEKIMNDKEIENKIKITKAIDMVENKIKGNLSGSKEYKKFTLSHILDKALKTLQEDK